MRSAMNWFKDIDKGFDKLLTESYQRREMEMEALINRLRFMAVCTLFLFELAVGFSKLGPDPMMLGFTVGTLVVTGLWCKLVAIKSGATDYNPWLKYATIFADYSLIVLITVEVNYLAHVGDFLREMHVTEFELMIVSMLMLFNILSAFRQGKLVIYFSTLLCLITGTIILEHSHTVREIQLHEQLLILFSGLLAWSISNYITNTYTRLRHRERLLRYLPKKLVSAVEKGQVDIAPGGKQQTVTVLMADIRNFTSMCEQHDAETITLVLNRYFAAMTEEIFNQSGMIDKFIGDAIMAVFGTPDAVPNHAQSAINAAQQMLARLPKLNAELAKDGLPQLAIGIGIHSGDAIAGNVGSAARMDYTVIGDTVNVAARIESLTKEVNKALLVSDSTINESGDESLVFLAEMPVKGRVKPISVYCAP